MYFAIEASEILMSNFISSLCIRVRPKSGFRGSWFESNRGFVLELLAVPSFRAEPSKSNTNEILDDASR
jgi:hypothetical protein